MKNFIFLILLIITMPAFTQVSINNDNSNPDPSAMLDVKSTTKGMLIPRLTAEQRDAILSPATGLLIFCTQNNLYYLNKGTPAAPDWVVMSSRWLTNGSDIYFSEGYVGIGTVTPSTKLDIAGGNWDLINGEGDFRIGNNLYRLKAGIAVDGWGAGDAGIMQYGQPGGYNILSLGAQGHKLLFLNGNSQKVGIGTDNPGATLDVQGTLRLADGSQGAGKVLSSDANGLASWVTNPSSISWSLTGNSGTSSGTNFIGTTDNVPLMFKINNQQAGKIEFSSYNTSLGYSAMKTNTSGAWNSAFGTGTMYSNTTGNYNTAIGVQAMYTNTVGTGNSAFGAYSLNYNTAGNYNTAIGLQALYLNTTGVNNTATGAGSLYQNSIGSNNTAAGHNALLSNTTGSNNTAIGSMALGFNTTGEFNTATGTNALVANTTGYFNTANGINALYQNTLGYENTAIGGNALFNNIDGYQNTAVGVNALYSNTSGIYNTSTGWQSLYTNTTGGYNTANGYWALSYNTTGYRNTSTGFRSLTYNSTGANNTANGVDALLWNTEGFQNTAVGANSLYNNTLGAYNTAVGYNTGPGSGMLYNTTCIGIDAYATNSDMVRIGNTYVGSIGGYQNWTNISDSRFKENVHEDVPGLSFIKQLRPVTYQLNREKINEFTGVAEKHRELSKQNPNIKFLTGEKYSEATTGFIAQEVEDAAKSLGFQFSGVDAPKSENDMYGLRYAEFVVPLVKAVQEQQLMIEELKEQNITILAEIEKLKEQNKDR